MFGHYDIPFKIMNEEISLCVDREGKNLARIGGTERVGELEGKAIEKQGKLTGENLIEHYLHDSYILGLLLFGKAFQMDRF